MAVTGLVVLPALLVIAVAIFSSPAAGQTCIPTGEFFTTVAGSFIPHLTPVLHRNRNESYKLMQIIPSHWVQFLHKCRPQSPWKPFRCPTHCGMAAEETTARRSIRALLLQLLCYQKPEVLWLLLHSPIVRQQTLLLPMLWLEQRLLP